MKKRLNSFFTTVFFRSIFTCTPVAQTACANTFTFTYMHTDDNYGKWGLPGIIGLFGLAGLEKREKANTYSPAILL